jgi:hypothetical protein
MAFVTVISPPLVDAPAVLPLTTATIKGWLVLHAALIAAVLAAMSVEFVALVAA